VATPDLVELDAIKRDFEFVGRFVGSAQAGATLLSVVGYFCMFPFLSLFVHESEAKLTPRVPQLSGLMSASAKDVVARSRHSLKLFDDTARGIAGQVAYFRDQIESAHRTRFLRPIPWPWAKDLGIYIYDGLPVSTTHVVTFVIGLQPRRIVARSAANEVRSIAEEYGRYFAVLGVTLDLQARSFLSSMDASRLRHEDHRSSRYYRTLFNGTGTPDINALLNVFRVMATFASRLLSLDTSVESWQTIFKIRFLTLYHVLSSLSRLRGTRSNYLTPKSMAYLHSILDTSDARHLMSPAIRPFRNTLMHYGLDNRVPSSSLSLTTPLYGLVPICLPGESHTTLDAKLTRQLDLTTESLNQWAVS